VSLLPVLIPDFEFGRSESITRDVAFMQAAQFGFDHLDESRPVLYGDCFF